MKKSQHYSIVDNYNTEELKALNFKVSEINSLKKISMYDEILVDPDIEKVK